MSSGGVVERTARRISPLGIASKRLEQAGNGTTLFAMYASVGAVATLGTDAVWNQALLGVAPHPGRSDGRFLGYWLRHLSVDLGAIVRTSTQDNLNADQVSNFPFTDLAVVEQRRIADFLDHHVSQMDAVIVLRYRQIELVAEALEAFREERLVDSEGVKRVPLQWLTDPTRPIVYGIVQAGDDVADGVPYIKTGDMSPLRPDLLSRTSPEVDWAYRRARVRPGDIVIAMRASIGLPIVIPPDLPRANLTQGTARIAPGRNVDLRWLYQVLKTRTVQGQCKDRAVGTTFMTLNIWDLRRIVIPVAPQAVRALLAVAVDTEERRVTSAQQAMRKQVELLQERKQALITAAVMGEFDVTTATGRGVA